MTSDAEINKKIVKAIKKGASPAAIAALLRKTSSANQADFIKRVTRGGK